MEWAGRRAAGRRVKMDDVSNLEKHLEIAHGMVRGLREDFESVRARFEFWKERAAALEALLMERKQGQLPLEGALSILKEQVGGMK